MRRLGVRTFHRCIDYGSYWQARCLVEGLRGMGVEAELLDHDSPRVTRAELRCALSPTLPQRTPRSDFPARSEEHTPDLQSLMRIPYAVFCLKKTIDKHIEHEPPTINKTNTHITKLPTQRR